MSTVSVSPTSNVPMIVGLPVAAVFDPVAAGTAGGNIVTDAAGPETLSFEALLRLLASATGVRYRFVHTSASLGLVLTRLVGLMLREVVLSRDEVDGLMAGLLTSDCAPTGITTLSSRLNDNGDVLLRRHVSELRRNYRR